MHKKLGLSLLEMMISLSLSMIILSAMYQWLACVYRDWLLVDQIAKTVERGRAVTGLLAQAFDRAGFLGCQFITQSQQVGHALPLIMQQPAAMIHEQNSKLLPVLSGNHHHFHEQFPQFIINKTTHPPIAFSVQDRQRKLIRLREDKDYPLGTQLVISDCHYHQFVKVYAIHSQNVIELDSAIVKELTHALRVTQYQSERFYVAQTQRKDEQGTAIYALYHHYLTKQAGVAARELIDRVDDMEVQWLSATAEPNIGKAMMITLLLRSEQSIVEGLNGLQMNRRTLAYSHPYLLKVWRLIFPLERLSVHEKVST